MRQKTFVRSNWGVLGSMFPFLWPKDNPKFRIRVLISFVALIIAKVSAVATPLFMIWSVDSLAIDGVNETSASIIGMGSLSLVVCYGFMRLFSVGFNQLRDGVFTIVGQRALRNMAIKTFSHIHALPLQFHISRKTGALSRVIERGVKGVDFLLRFLIFSIVPLILELIFVAILLLIRYDWIYVLIVFVTIFFYTWFTFWVTNIRVRIRERMNRSDSDANQKAIDSLLNFETVKFFNAEKREIERYDSSMAGFEKASIQTNISLAYLNFGQSVLMTAGLVGVMILAANGVSSGLLTVGEFVGINAIMLQLLMPLNFLGTVYREIRQALTDMADMFRILDQPLMINDKLNPVILERVSGEVRFNNVNFSYSSSRTILTKVDFEVKPGQILAIVGPSGSGKSTIGRLLFRFYDVDSGSIHIDGTDIRELKQSQLREFIGVVPQDTVLFNDTIGYNIAYGYKNASFEDIKKVTKAARLFDFVNGLPEGFDTVVGERGLKLSGGEKQRVGIARTLLKNPKILLLDEATSALDTETEKKILKGLIPLFRGRSVISIAHRLSTISSADKIIVIDEGRVVEYGSHSSLLNERGKYFRLWNQQLNENI
ncbi:MAG: ABC transporter ATP-binding protein/permease [Pseudomonadota bacterium]|nr:ABC transporter ATP-binding protein/permease [Pseudomonadota bacterium]